MKELTSKTLPAEFSVKLFGVKTLTQEFEEQDWKLRKTLEERPRRLLRTLKGFFGEKGEMKCQ